MDVEPLNPEPPTLRFGPFELDLQTSELRRDGVRVKLQLQPFRVLALLARHPGRLLTREEIQREVWPDGTFVDFEQALNFCVRQIRSALGDHAAMPLYVETLPRRGYRFIARVTSDVPAAAEADREAAVPVEDSTARLRWRWARIASAAGALGVALIAGAAGYALRAPAPRILPRFDRLTFDRGFIGSARFGPGDQVLYTAAWDGKKLAVYDVRTGNRDSRPVETTASKVVSVSLTGDVAYLREPGKLTRAPLAGGPAKDLLEGIRSADRTNDGESFAVARDTRGRTRIEYPVGTVLCEAVRPSGLRISPDGERVAFLEHPIRNDDRGWVSVVDRTGQKKVLSGGWASVDGLAWSPRGNEVWFTAAQVGADSALHGVDLAGQERMIVPALGRLVLHDVARDGRVLLERKTLRFEMHYGEEGAADERDLSWMELARAQALSPDGRTLLFMQSGEVGGPDYGVYLRGTDGAVPVRLGSGRPLGFSSDGRWVLAIPVRTPDRVDLLPIGAGEIRAVREAGLTDYEWATWVPGRNALVFTARQGGVSRVFFKELAGGAARPITPPGVTIYANTVSPDGERLAVPCVSGLGWCVQPIEGGPATPLPGTVDKQVMGWTADGKALYLRDAEPQRPLRIYRLALDTFRLEPWKELAPRDTSGVMSVPAVAVTPDGHAWAYSYPRQIADLYLVTGLQ